jgi:hypothetical protein
MPQRVNAKADIGNSKVASDVYDTNNIFLTDQGWVYRHWKGEPSTGRYWDEILVAGQVDPDPAVGTSDSIEPTSYYRKDTDPVSGDVTMNLVDRSDDPFYYLATGNQKYPAELTTGEFEVDGGDPDTHFDVEYSEHTELVPAGTTILAGEKLPDGTDASTDTVLTEDWIKEWGTPTNYEPDALKDTEGNVVPPELPQFPEVEGYETPGYTPPVTP